MPLKHRAPGAGKGRAGNHLSGIQCRGQGIGHRPDIALGRGIEGGAIFEEYLFRTLRLEPGQRRERLGDGLIGWDRAAFERHHTGLHLRARRAIGQPVILHHAHAALGQGIGQIAGAGEIIADTAEQHHVSPGRVSPACAA